MTSYQARPRVRIDRRGRGGHRVWRVWWRDAALAALERKE